MKRMLLAFCTAAAMLPRDAAAQESARFRPASEAAFRTEDAAAQGLHALAILGAQEYLNQTFPGIQTQWASERLHARYICATGRLKLDRAGSPDSAQALLAEVASAPVHDRLSLAIARYYFLHSELAAAIPYYEAAGIANLSNSEIADAKFELAYCYFNNRRFGAADTLFAIMKEVPGKYYSPGNYYYGLLAYNAGDYKAALRSFDRISSEPLYRPVVPYYMAEIYYFMGEREKALAAALRLIQLPEKLYYDNELHLLAAQCLFESGRYGDALPYFEHYYEHTDKVRKEELYEMGYSYYRVSEWKSAIEKFRPLSAAQDSLGQTAMYLLGDSYLKTGNKESARSAFGICASMRYNAAQREAALLLHAKLSYETGFTDDAMHSVRTLLSDFPSGKYVADARLLQSQLYLGTSNFKDAYEALTAAGGRGGDDYASARQRAAYGYAIQQWQGGRLAEASALLGASLDYPASRDYTVAAQFWKAEAAYRLHQYDSALYFGQQFIAATDAQRGASMVSPGATPAHAWLTIGYAALEMKDFPRAQQAFKSAQSGGTAEVSATAVLREADAFFMQKEFAKAAPLYAAAATGRGADADYARLQSAILAGLRGDEGEKTRLLQSVMSSGQSSSYAIEARYELGVTQLAASQYDAAIATLQPVIAGGSASPLTVKALLKTGTAQQQLNQDDKALETYRRIIRDWPAAPERTDALAAVKSIYIERNQPDAYSRLLQDFHLPQASDAELDAAYYNAAEGQYAAGKWREAQAGFSRYIQLYPSGAKSARARFYLANSFYNVKQYQQARAAYDTVLQGGWGSFSEESARKAAELSNADTLYSESGRYYSMLAAHAASNATRVQAYAGLMNAASHTGSNVPAARYADTLITLPDVPATIRDEAVMYTIRRNLSDSAAAGGIDSLLRPLQESPNGAVAAEARYYAAQSLLRSGKLKDAEAAASRNIKRSAGYDYWVIKTYLLLGDILIKEKDYFNARATLQSVVQHAGIPALKAEAQQKLDGLKAIEGSKLSNE